MENWLKTADAARLAGVGTTAIKRWADEGRLACRKTPGGHRRYRRDDLQLILHQDRDRDRDVLRWVELARSAGPAEFEAELLLARARLGAWFRVAEIVGSAIAEIGQMWVRGELTIVDEHRATERIRRALATVSERMIVQGGSNAVLVNAPGDPHTLGLSLVEIALREAGFDTVWLGARVPASEFDALLETTPVALIAASASAASSDATVLGDFAHELIRAAEPYGTLVALGGVAPWPDAPQAHRFTGWEQFSEFAKALAETSRSR